MSGEFSSSEPLVTFILLVLTWFVSESVVRRLTRGSNRGVAQPAPQDRGSLWVILVGIGGALTDSVLLYLSGVGGVFPWPVLWVGVVVSLGGSAVRGWAISSLGRFFSPVIRIESGHQIVRLGPYRWLRHPSYTGIYFSAVGAVVALGTVAGTVLTAVVILIVLGYRIRLEERMLIDRFGEEYEEYARSTWRLLPGIY